MKTIIEEINSAKHKAGEAGFIPSDAAYWAYVEGCLHAVADEREWLYQREIGRLADIASWDNVPGWMRRQAE